jgi:gelsolin
MCLCTSNSSSHFAYTLLLQKFQGYFDNLKYLEGGVASGFNIVEPTVDTPHLYRIKGTHKALSLTQMPLKKSSLNAGDSFVLVANKSKVWVWHGSDANPDEQAKANRHAESICTEGTVVVVDQDQEGAEDFWSCLEADSDEIAAGDENSDDAVDSFVPLLFQLPTSKDEDEEPQQIAKASSGSGARFGVPSNPTLDKSLLDDSNVYLLDVGWELFLWMGAQADRMEKLAGMQQAERYAKEDPRTMDVPLTIVKSGFEDGPFAAYFVA